MTRRNGPSSDVRPRAFHNVILTTWKFWALIASFCAAFATSIGTVVLYARDVRENQSSIAEIQEQHPRRWKQAIEDHARHPHAGGVTSKENELAMSALVQRLDRIERMLDWLVQKQRER